MQNSNDTFTRSVVKATIWSGLGLLIMMLVGLFVTGSLWQGGSIALINALLGAAMYFVYERIWARIKWGRHV